MIARGRFASMSATGMVEGTISLKTRHSRTRRAISWAYWAPKSTTRTLSNGSAAMPSSYRRHHALTDSDAAARTVHLDRRGHRDRLLVARAVGLVELGRTDAHDHAHEVLRRRAGRRADPGAHARGVGRGSIRLRRHQGRGRGRWGRGVDGLPRLVGGRVTRRRRGR